MNNKRLPAGILGYLKPDKCALLVIDKQVGYIQEDQPLIKSLKTNTNDFQAKVPRLDSFIEKLRSLSVPVIWTQMIENVDESPPNISLKMKLGGTATVINSHDESFDIFGRVLPLPGEKVVVKKHFDAFIGTDLHEYLQGIQRSSIILAGGYAARCVLATTFAGNSLGYNIFWAEDLVGAPAHFKDELPVALGLVDSVLGYLAPSDELIKALSDSSNP